MREGVRDLSEAAQLELMVAFMDVGLLCKNHGLEKSRSSSRGSREQQQQDREIRQQQQQKQQQEEKQHQHP